MLYSLGLEISNVLNLSLVF